jgi:hypothetical protein
MINDNKDLKERLIMLSCAIAGVEEIYPEANDLFEKLKTTKGYTGFRTINLLAACIVIEAKKKKLRLRIGYLMDLIGLRPDATKIITKRYFEEENK